MARLLGRVISKTPIPARLPALAAAVVLAGAFGGVGGVTLASSASSPSNELIAGQVLTTGGQLASSNGFELVMQSDGNLVAYDACQAPFWQTGTYGHRGDSVTMQRDGNLVVYSPAGKALWASDTAGLGGSHLVLQTDGNIVIYTASNRPVWASGTERPQCVSGLAGPQGPTGPAGLAGPAGANGNTILSGATTPLSGTGSVGDFYLDTATETLYGPKTTVWPTPARAWSDPGGRRGRATTSRQPPGPLGRASRQPGRTSSWWRPVSELLAAGLTVHVASGRGRPPDSLSLRSTRLRDPCKRCGHLFFHRHTGGARRRDPGVNGV